MLKTVQERAHFVYILASRSLTLYIGVTGNLQRRVNQHKQHGFGGFTAEYKIERLVYFERFNDIHNAISREKQLKGWRREKKIALIKSRNPTWIDLSEEWDRPVEMQVLRLRESAERTRSAQDDNA